MIIERSRNQPIRLLSNLSDQQFLMPSISRIVTTLALLLAPIIAIGQSEPDWIGALPEIPNCVAKVSPVTKAGKGYYQGATYDRKKSEEELAYEATPIESREFVEVPIISSHLPDHCGSIGISVDVPRLKVRKPKLTFGPSPYRARILMRNMEAYLTRNVCDVIPCYEPFSLDVTFAKGRILTITLDPRCGDVVAFARSVDFAKLNDEIDSHLKQSAGK